MSENKIYSDNWSRIHAGLSACCAVNLYLRQSQYREFNYYMHFIKTTSLRPVIYLRYLKYLRCPKHLRCYGAIALSFLSVELFAETINCPADHHERGKKPPAGTEWQCLDKDGQPDGPWLTWYGSGQLMSERQMKSGKEHGRQRSWWPNGQLMMEGISYEGNRYKGFKYWSINGEPTQLNIETETVTKQVDETGKPLPTPSSPAPTTTTKTTSKATPADKTSVAK